jgi:hypothetical protein
MTIHSNGLLGKDSISIEYYGVSFRRFCGQYDTLTQPFVDGELPLRISLKSV